MLIVWDDFVHNNATEKDLKNLKEKDTRKADLLKKKKKAQALLKQKQLARQLAERGQRHSRQPSRRRHCETKRRLCYLGKRRPLTGRGQRSAGARWFLAAWHKAAWQTAVAEAPLCLGPTTLQLWGQLLSTGL